MLEAVNDSLIAQWTYFPYHFYGDSLPSELLLEIAIGKATCGKVQGEVN